MITSNNLSEDLLLAVDAWFAANTSLGGCSDADVNELAAIFYANHNLEKAWSEGFKSGADWRDSVTDFWKGREYGTPPAPKKNPYGMIGVKENE